MQIPTIGLYLPTRGRQHLAIATLNMWQQLAADPSNIKFMMGVDDDDGSSAKIIPGDSLEVIVFDKDVITCGQRVKILSDEMMKKHDVDIYISIVDHSPPLTQHWDNILRQQMAGGGHECVNLYYEAAPNALHITATTKKWMSLANKFEPQIFPFWFSDQWRVETYCYVFGTAPITLPDVKVGTCSIRKTQNMREMEFWWGLFKALRPLRLKQAYEIYQGYELTCPTLEKFIDMRRDMIDMFCRVDNSKRREFKYWEEHAAEVVTEPSEKYLRCKANADKLIEREGLELWKMQF